MGREQQPTEEAAPGLSRRSLLAGASLATGTVAALGLAGTAEAAPGASGGVGVGPPGTTAAEFLLRIRQSGAAFVGVGYLTAVAGLPASALFSGSARTEASALYTAYATGQLVQRVQDQNVHALDIAGSLTVYRRDTPGASFGDPASFRVGQAVAAFDMTLQDVLTVFAPAQGLPTLTGDMRQTDAAGPPQLGHRGLRARLFATGLGALVDPDTPTAELKMAGHWTTE